MRAARDVERDGDARDGRRSVLERDRAPVAGAVVRVLRPAGRARGARRVGRARVIATALFAPLLAACSADVSGALGGGNRNGEGPPAIGGGGDDDSGASTTFDGGSSSGDASANASDASASDAASNDGASDAASTP